MIFFAEPSCKKVPHLQESLSWGLRAFLFAHFHQQNLLVAHWAPTPNALLFAFKYKVLIKLFQKFAQSRRVALSLSAESEISFPAFSFCLAFSFVPFASKEKAENSLA